MRQFSKHIIFLFFFGCFFTHTIFSQYKIPKKPDFQTSVFDYVGLLSASEKVTLENKLVKYSDSTSTQIVVGIINTTKGEDIGYLATNWAHKWGIGQGDKDNGVFMLLAKKDKKITIRTGYGTEHLLTDYTSRQIIEYDILPHFRQGDFYAGLDAGSNAIFRVMNGEYKGTRQQNQQGSDSGLIIFIIILIIFFVLISRGNRGNRGGRRRYRNTDSRDILETIILSNTGRGSFGGGSVFGGGSSGGFGGGGFGGGFGGGGFGGGGATGGW